MNSEKLAAPPRAVHIAGRLTGEIATSKTPRTANRIPALDGLCGLAATMVIVVHLWTEGFFSAYHYPR